MKGVLVIASVVTGVSSVVIEKMLANKAKQQTLDQAGDHEDSIDGLRRAVRTVGAVNIATNAATGAVTTMLSTMLSMEAAKSLPFAAISRLVP